MNRQLTFCLVADGGTDRALIPIIEWAIHRLDPDVDILEADFRKRTSPVRNFLASLTTNSMIVFVHRDAERGTIHDRLTEFEGHGRADIVPIVPVRMTEAWLLIDAAAIAAAADRPDAIVQLPAVAGLGTLVNPKQRLEDLLLAVAGELTGRRLKRFRRSIVDRRINVASLIGDFAPLEQLEAFRCFQAELASAYPYK
jgi:hypothetical protein